MDRTEVETDVHFLKGRPNSEKREEKLKFLTKFKSFLQREELFEIILDRTDNKIWNFSL